MESPADSTGGCNNRDVSDKMGEDIAQHLAGPARKYHDKAPDRLQPNEYGRKESSGDLLGQHLHFVHERDRALKFCRFIRFGTRDNLHIDGFEPAIVPAHHAEIDLIAFF